jgi:ribosomal protein S18 acetylase RimI-like enzyme
VSDVSIRRARSADAPAIARVVNDAYREAEAFFIRGDRIDETEVARLLERGAFLLAEHQGVLLGSVYVEDRGDHGYIGLLSVDPRLQREGLGRTLMAAAEESLAAAGRPRAELLVVNLRRELPAWYGKQGYREVGTRAFPPDAPNFLPCHYLVMSKRLRSARDDMPALRSLVQRSRSSGAHADGATDGTADPSGSCAR